MAIPNSYVRNVVPLTFGLKCPLNDSYNFVPHYVPHVPHVPHLWYIFITSFDDLICHFCHIFDINPYFAIFFVKTGTILPAGPRIRDH